MKHAYCIIAHGAPNVLQALLSCIDDDRNDIFILIDKKSKCEEIHHMTVQKSKLTYVKEIAIYWGDISLVEAELTLFEAVTKVGGYGHVHLLSGVDMPLKNQDYIHHVCDDIYPDKNFITVAPSGSDVANTARERVSYYYFFGKAARKSRIFQKVRDVIFSIQKKFDLRRACESKISAGSNWVTLTMAFCDYLSSHKKTLLKRYRYCSCPDEIYKQTLFINSPFSKTAFVADDYRCSNMRKIDWHRGNPYVWKMTDVEELRTSDAWFARKIDDDGIFLRILQEIANCNFATYENSTVGIQRS